MEEISKEQILRSPSDDPNANKNRRRPSEISPVHSGGSLYSNLSKSSYVVGHDNLKRTISLREKVRKHFRGRNSGGYPQDQLWNSNYTLNDQNDLSTDVKSAPTTPEAAKRKHTSFKKSDRTQQHRMAEMSMSARSPKSRPQSLAIDISPVGLSPSQSRLNKFFGSESPISSSSSQITLADSFKTLDNMLEVLDTYRTPEDVPEFAKSKYNEWQDLVPEQAKPFLAGEKIKRYSAIWELIQTEYNHFKLLSLMKTYFLEPLEELQHNNILKHVKNDQLFVNIAEVYKSSLELCFQLYDIIELSETKKEQCPTEISSWEEFDPHDDFLSPALLFEIFENVDFTLQSYLTFCESQFESLKYLKHSEQRSEDFKTFIDWCEAKDRCGRQHLKDLLAVPMQRMTKYSLLLSAIAKYVKTPELQPSISQALLTTESFLKVINENVRAKDNKNKIMELSLQLSMDGTHQVRLSQPDRDIIHEGSLSYQTAKEGKIELYAFLFTDLFLLCRSKLKNTMAWFKDPIELNNLEVFPNEDPNNQESTEKQFNIIFRESNVLKVMQVQTGFKSETKNWIDSIKRQKKEIAQKAMSLDELLDLTAQKISHLVESLEDDDLGSNKNDKNDKIDKNRTPEKVSNALQELKDFSLDIKKIQDFSSDAKCVTTCGK